MREYVEKKSTRKSCLACWKGKDKAPSRSNIVNLTTVLPSPQRNKIKNNNNSNVKKLLNEEGTDITSIEDTKEENKNHLREKEGD